MAPNIDPELLEAFLAESSDLLEQSEKTLLDLERRPEDARDLQALFRHYHTLKGAAAAVGLAEVATYVHHGESLLQGVKVGTVKVESGRLVDFFFRFNDSIKGLIAEACGAGERSGEIVRDVENAIAALQKPLGKAAKRRDESAAAGEEDAAAPESDTLDSDPAILRVPAARIDALMQRTGELLAQRSRLDGTARRFVVAQRKLDASRRRLSTALDGIPDRGGEQGELLRSAVDAVADTRDAAGELSALVRELRLELRHLSQASAHLQRQITRLRLVPLDTLFRRLARAVREAAKQEEKRVALDVEGGDVQVDRLIAEALYPPLLHLVRNAVSHGIEDPELRQKRGKPAAGVIRLSARPRYNRVVLSVGDDGAGLNYEAILAKARAQDLIPAGSVPRRDQLVSFIFRPGFTTEDSVTEMSGRGVGLDVVAREVAALKGTLAANSEHGQGTTFQIAVPMTASIEEVALVEVGQQVYALPTDFMEQSILIDARALEKLRTGRVYSFRGQQIPVLFLAPLVSEPVAAEGAVVIVLRAMERAMALVVQRVLAKEEVIVRPLGRVLEAHPFLSGATVTGSGQVIFVVNGARLFDVLSYTAVRSAEPPEERLPVDDLPQRGVLLVDDSKSIRKLASQFLAAESIDTETAVDGIDALEKLASSRFQVVVTDLEMPRLHGYELLVAIKRDPRWSHLPVIVCTSRSSEKHRKRARELGADGYITKPFTKDQLCGEVARLRG